MSLIPAFEIGVWNTWIFMVALWFTRNGASVWRPFARLGVPSLPWTENDDGPLLRAEFHSFAPPFESDAAGNLGIRLHVLKLPVTLHISTF